MYSVQCIHYMCEHCERGLRCTSHHTHTETQGRLTVLDTASEPGQYTNLSTMEGWLGSTERARAAQ